MRAAATRSDAGSVPSDAVAGLTCRAALPWCRANPRLEGRSVAQLEERVAVPDVEQTVAADDRARDEAVSEEHRPAGLRRRARRQPDRRRRGPCRRRCRSSRPRRRSAARSTPSRRQQLFLPEDAAVRGIEREQGPDAESRPRRRHPRLRSSPRPARARPATRTACRSDRSAISRCRPVHRDQHAPRRDVDRPVLADHRRVVARARSARGRLRRDRLEHASRRRSRGRGSRFPPLTV